MQQVESWQPIIDFPSYDVSNFGKVRSRVRKNGCLKLSRTSGNYLKVTLYPGGKTHLVHRLVAQAFISNSHGLTDVNHKDGNKSNNRVENLEWMSHSANRIHAVTTGLCKNVQGSRRRLSEAEAQQVWNWYEQGIKQSDIAKRLEVTPGAISHIISGRTWKHLRSKSMLT